MKRLLTLAVTIIGLGLSGYASADIFVNGDAAAGKAKARACGACHGATGNSSSAQFPKLAGQNASYALAQLKHFKSGARTNAIMQGQVKNLSEQDMANIAVFYSEQKIKAGAATEELAHIGEKIYRGGNPASGVPACIGCHGPAGEGIPSSSYPAIGGQHADYTSKQLLDYRREGRTNPMADIMQGVTIYLTEKEINALSSYIQGLH